MMSSLAAPFTPQGLSSGSDPAPFTYVLAAIPFDVVKANIWDELWPDSQRALRLVCKDIHQLSYLLFTSASVTIAPEDPTSADTMTQRARFHQQLPYITGLRVKGSRDWDAAGEGEEAAVAGEGSSLLDAYLVSCGGCLAKVTGLTIHADLNCEDAVWLSQALPNLQSFNLQTAQLYGAFFAPFQECPRLKEVTLLFHHDNTHNTHWIVEDSSQPDEVVAVLESLATLRNLQCLTVDKVTRPYLPFSSKAVAAVGGLTRLERLSVGPASAPNIPFDPEQLHHLRPLVKLTCLELSVGHGLFNEIPDLHVHMQHIAMLTSLQQLDLGALRLDSASFATLQPLTNLTVLVVGNIELTDDHHQQPMTSLTELKIHPNSAMTLDNMYSCHKLMPALTSFKGTLALTTGLSETQLARFRARLLDLGAVWLSTRESAESIVLSVSHASDCHASRLVELLSGMPAFCGPRKLRIAHPFLDNELLGQLCSVFPHLEDVQIWGSGQLTAGALRHLFRLTHLSCAMVCQCDQISRAGLVELAISWPRSTEVSRLWLHSDLWPFDDNQVGQQDPDENFDFIKLLRHVHAIRGDEYICPQYVWT